MHVAFLSNIVYGTHETIVSDKRSNYEFPFFNKRALESHLFLRPF